MFYEVRRPELHASCFDTRGQLSGLGSRRPVRPHVPVELMPLVQVEHQQVNADTYFSQNGQGIRAAGQDV